MSHATITKTEKPIQSYISNDEMRMLAAVSPARLVVDTVALWSCILGSLYLWSATRNPLVFIAVFIIIATRQHALNTFVHEAAHGNIVRSDRKLNDFISDILYAGPHLISTQGYRDKHMDHHKHLGSAEQDLEIKCRYIIRGKRFVTYSLLVLSGLQLFRSAREYQKSMSQAQSERLMYVLTVCGTNALLLGYCFVIGDALAYFYLWLAPLFTLTMYIATMRVIAEHQPVSYERRQEETFTEDIVPPFTCTIVSNIVERFFFAPLNFNFHHEHHMLPGVPYGSLPRLHELLVERGYYNNHPEWLSKTYVGVLHNKVFADTSAD